MSKRRAPAPSTSRRARWDRQRVFVTLMALLVVVTLLVSGLSVLFYGQ